MARLSFRCSDELSAAVDRARGDVPREVWLRRAVEGRLGAELGLEAPQPSVPFSSAGKSGVQQASELAGKGGLVGELFQKVADDLVANQPSGHLPTCKCPVCK